MALSLKAELLKTENLKLNADETKNPKTEGPKLTPMTRFHGFSVVVSNVSAFNLGFGLNGIGGKNDRWIIAVCQPIAFWPKFLNQ